MGILRFPWKSSSETSDPMIGILAFEVAGLMSRVVSLWHSLSDKEVMWLREQIGESVGVKRFVSEDENYLMDLVLEEIVENFGGLSRSVARLGKKCKDPSYRRLEDFYNDPAKNDPSWLGWSYTKKKMDRKVKKMERLVASTSQLSHEQDVLVELEQTLRRMEANGAGFDRAKVVEFRQKVAWQRQAVKSLRGLSPWTKTHRYVVRLLARSLFTVLERIKAVFGDAGPDPLSFSPAVYPAETATRNRLRVSRSKRRGGSFGGCVEIRSPASIGGSMRLVPTYAKPERRRVENENVYSKISMFNSKSKALNARVSTLGDAALALRYANIVRLVEKLASLPHLVGPDARDDLYDMLPGSIRGSLRAKLRNSAGSYGYDPGLAAQWNNALAQILEWLGPLAHNTIRWRSERNIEKQNEFERSNVLLVQTLYHADRDKTEAAITELLLGLNYICRISAVEDTTTTTTMIREQASS